ncbi:MAG: hypothetical protein RSD47_10460 [Romboutsia sp.]
MSSEGCWNINLVKRKDEIHTFSKSHQSSILSYIVTGKITLIASTTENPYHSIHPAILSRCMVFELKAIGVLELIINSYLVEESILLNI